MRSLLFLCLLFLNFHATADVKVAVQKLNGRVTSVMQRKGTPGLAVGVVSGGKVLFAKGYGVKNLDTKAPITPKTVFQLGSVSKALSGTLVGILVHMGKLNLNTTLKNYLPHYTFGHEAITLSHVVTHTTGIPRKGFNALIESEKKTRDEIHTQIARTPLSEDPGVYDYHNAVFSLIDPIIERNLGIDFESALKTYLFDPLGMTSSSASHDALLACHDRAFPHKKAKMGHVACKSYRTGYYEVKPAGGINSNLEDMLKFLNAQLGYEPSTLNKTTLSLIHTPRTHAKDIFLRNPINKKRFKASSYGIGWRVLDYKGYKIVFHGGWLKGFINIMAFIPEKDVGIVILQNAETSAPWVITMNFLDDVLGHPETNWDTHSPAAPPANTGKKEKASKAAKPIKLPPKKPQPLKNKKVKHT